MAMGLLWPWRSCLKESGGGACCQSASDAQVETITQFSRTKPKIADFVALLKGSGGPSSPDAAKHRVFLALLDNTFPELQLYRSGIIQTSPGVEEIADSPTEYYRTVGAIIALLSCFAAVNGDAEIALSWVSAGDRGPMSLDQAPGKFINMGNKPEEYQRFCEQFARGLKADEDWWAMLVFLVVHDVGKSDEFRNRVNATLPKVCRSDDHDRALAQALRDPELLNVLLPSVHQLGPEKAQRLADGFATNFHLPQLGQGEVTCCSLRGLLQLPQCRLTDGTLRSYFYHSIFDIAGAQANERFIYPVALAPVYMGFVSALEDLLKQLTEPARPDERGLYFDFLCSNFRKSFPEFEEGTFRGLCDSRVFRDETGLAFLRVMALTRYTYKNVAALLDMLSVSFHDLVGEMSGNCSGTQIMLYYGPDFLRMGLGSDLEDESGANMRAALQAMEEIYALARAKIRRSGPDIPDQGRFDLNLQPMVSRIKAAGPAWRGGTQLRELVAQAIVQTNDYLTEGLVRFEDELRPHR